jgi:acetylornithine deacetylase
MLLIDVHQDTVGVEGMSRPFTPRIEGGLVYGRGACDVKGSLAVILAVLAKLAEQPPPHMPTVIVACTVNEENGFTGARRLVRSWAEGDSTLVTRAPDVAVVAEPTSLNVVVTHKGVVRWRCRTVGRAAHSSCPQAGENAIYTMAPIILALREYNSVLSHDRGSHPLLGPATLSVGTIRGGLGVNTVPDRCSIEIDRRLLPNEEPMEAQTDVKRYIAQRSDAAAVPLHEAPFLAAPALSDTHNGQIAARLLDMASRTGVSARRIGVPYCTDACAIGATGVPTVVFGPGSIDQAHTVDEWIAIEQLHQAAAILYGFCCEEPPAPAMDIL